MRIRPDPRERSREGQDLSEELRDPRVPNHHREIVILLCSGMTAANCCYYLPD